MILSAITNLVSLHVLIFSSSLLPPLSPLYPYTTLFRSYIRSATRPTGFTRWSGTRTASGSPRPAWTRASASGKPTARSEEHTSELQSLRHLVCRLLLEKKKTEKKHKRYIIDDTNHVSYK